jgi:broad specificity phosphatase PhoE
VRSLAERWKSEEVKFDRAVTSTLIRARETAEIVASALNVKIEYDPIWMERDIGEMEGLTAEEVRKKPRPPYTTPYDAIGGVGEGWACTCAGQIASFVKACGSDRSLHRGCSINRCTSL